MNSFVIEIYSLPFLEGSNTFSWEKLFIILAAMRRSAAYQIKDGSRDVPTGPQ